MKGGVGVLLFQTLAKGGGIIVIGLFVTIKLFLPFKIDLSDLKLIWININPAPSWLHHMVSSSGVSWEGLNL